MDDSGNTDPSATTPAARSACNGDPRWTRRSTGDIRAPLRAGVVATHRNASVLRRRFHHWLALDVSPELLDDLVLAVYEALANVAEHGYADRPDGPGPLRLEAHRDSGHVLVTVADEGSWRAPTGERSRGRGLPLMRRLTNDVHIVAGHRGTVVRLWAEVPPARPSPPDRVPCTGTASISGGRLLTLIRSDASSRGERSETSVVDANQRSWAVRDKPARKLRIGR